MQLAAAQSGTASQPSPSPDAWQVVVAPYLWLTAVNGDATVRGTTVPVDVSISDVLESLKFGFMGQFEVRKGPFGLFVNPVFAKLEAENTTGSVTVSGPLGRRDVVLGPVKADVEPTMLLMDFGAFYRVGQWNLSEQRYPRFAVEPYVGGRLVSLDLDLSLSGANGFSRQISKSKTWVDPIIGFRAQLDLTENWNMILIADVGGFGVGADLTWQAMGLVGYRFGLFREKDANLLLGYRAIYEDYKTGSGDSEIGLSATIHGPIFGVSVRF